MAKTRFVAGRRHTALVLVAAGLGVLALSAVGAGASAPTGVVSAAPQNGLFKGSTAQGKPFSLKAKGGSVRKLKYKFQVGGCGVESTTTGKIPVSRGKFRHSSSQFDPNTLRSYETVVKGKFTTSTKVKGTINAGTPCGSKKIRYSARHT